MISIHSPHAGRDLDKAFADLTEDDFNPLSPCGERLIHWTGYSNMALFQSTLPMRGETDQQPMTLGNGFMISIHSPHAGRDVKDF